MSLICHVMKICHFEDILIRIYVNKKSFPAISMKFSLELFWISRVKVRWEMKLTELWTTLKVNCCICMGIILINIVGAGRHTSQIHCCSECNGGVIREYVNSLPNHYATYCCQICPLYTSKDREKLFACFTHFNQYSSELAHSTGQHHKRYCKCTKTISID